MITLSGDVHPNPGPPKTTWVCPVCDKVIHPKAISFQCNSNPTHRTHRRCAQTTFAKYHNSWICPIHSTNHHPTNSTRPLKTPNPTPNTTQRNPPTNPNPTPTHHTTQRNPPTNPIRRPPTIPNPTPTTNSTQHHPATAPPPLLHHANPGPPETTWVCPVCAKNIGPKATSLQCNTNPTHWTHLNCAQTTIAKYKKSPKTWTCPIHNTSHPPTNSTRKPLTNPNQIPTTNTTQRNPPVPPPPSRQTPLQTPTPTNPKTNQNDLIIIQINTNGIRSKLHELTDLAINSNADIITVQESKLTDKSKSPHIPNYTTVRDDRKAETVGGGLLTFIKSSITFTEIKPNLPNSNIELQLVKLHLQQNQHLHIANVYIPPRDTTNPHHDLEQQNITTCLTYLTSLDNTLITGDFNAHSPLWYSPITDQRGETIEHILTSSNHAILNLDKPTRLPNNPNQQPTSPDISTISNNLLSKTSWTTTTALSSDHLPITITIHTKAKFHISSNLHTFTNYNKANWPAFTNEIESILQSSATPSNPHTANHIITNAILLADKHHIPKGKITTRHTPLPDHIRDLINTRNQTRKSNPKDPSLPNQNTTINRQIQEHRTQLWKDHLQTTNSGNHKSNTTKLWSTIKSLSGKSTKPDPNRSIVFNHKHLTSNKAIANAFNHQFTHIAPHKTQHQNRTIDRRIKQLKPDPTFTLTEQEVQTAISNSTTNKSTGPDNINIQHLKHLGPIAITYLTSLFNLTLSQNNIPQIWKLAKIIPIPKPNKPANEGTSFRPISLLSPLAKVLEKTLLPHITEEIPKNPHQHGFKPQHSTTTVLNNIVTTIAEGFNQKPPPSRTVLVSLDMSKAFDTVNHHKLTEKLLNHTSINPTIIKFLSNYLKGRKTFTSYNQTTSSKCHLKTGVPQGSVLSPTLFNLYTSDLPTPPPNIHLDSFADDINTYSSHPNYRTAETTLQPYLNTIHHWTKENNLLLNPDKSSATLFTPDPAEYSNKLTLSINNTTIPTNRNPKILGITFDPKLTFSTHISNTAEKAKKSNNILKSLTTTKWGKSMETITHTYKAITRPILEYANPAWSTVASVNSHDTLTNKFDKLKTIQNTALRIATGCVADTNTHHLHHETKVLPIDLHLNLHASNYRQKTNLPTHPNHNLNGIPTPNRNMKTTIFHKAAKLITKPKTNHTTPDQITTNIKANHTLAVKNYHKSLPPHKLTNQPFLQAHPSEKTLPREKRSLLRQLRTDKSPFLLAHKNSQYPTLCPSPLCPLCKLQPHNTKHLFNCPSIPTTLTIKDLWTSPCKVSELLDTWADRMTPPNNG